MKLFTIKSMKITVLLFCALLLIGSCGKTEDSAPTPTQTGNNTVFCIINGTTFIFHGIPTTAYYHGVKIADKTSSLGGYFISAVNSGNSYNYLTFGIRTTKAEPGMSYNPASWWEGGVYISHYIQEENGIEVEYLFDSTNSYIHITRFDNDVAAGTFEFHGMSGTKHIDIINGFFDIKLY